MVDELIVPSFRLSEFIVSDAAIRNGFDNTPSGLILQTIKNRLAPGMQEVRDMLGCAVFITSGYRSRAVNAMVGGAPDSQHMLGEAADFKAPAFGTPRTVARYLVEHGSRLPFDQLIWEGGWVHISFSDQPRHQVLTAHFEAGKAPSYTPGIA